MSRGRRRSRDYDYGFAPYVPVAEKRRKAAKEMEKLKKKGHAVSPVVIEGRAIAKTFWGKAWCDNLERYSDFANRLPRGRTYVRNGSVVDLQIGKGEVRALVSGSSMYEVRIQVATVPQASWKAICKDCAGAIDSLVELLQGRFSRGVMERICQQKTGLFPSPKEIELSCSCPDWATMCKHVAAVLYGVGARLDERPELIFLLRGVDEQDLIAKASHDLPLSAKGPSTDKVLADDDLCALFGVELAMDETPVSTPPAPKTTRATTPKTKTKAKTKATPTAVMDSKGPAKKPKESVPRKFPTCVFPGCDKNRFVRGRGYCGEHWKRWQQGEILGSDEMVKRMQEQTPTATEPEAKRAGRAKKAVKR
ncbi:MAG: SWIM zinc finger family protein [Myxococcota bacterium]|jgi:uncharacterized Zn finger protein|nr:SWIM zinc finger family protein [Myxococcota bacterium]